MAWLGWVASGVSAIGGLMSAEGTLAAGEGEKEAAYAEANQMETQAGQVRAQSQRAAVEDRRQGRLAQSRAQALAAASGAGATDPTVLNIIGDLEKEGEYRALSDLYAGDSQAQSLEYGAKVRRKTGKQIQGAYQMQAAGTLAQTGSSLFAKYGGQYSGAT